MRTATRTPQADDRVEITKMEGWTERGSVYSGGHEVERTGTVLEVLDGDGVMVRLDEREAALGGLVFVPNQVLNGEPSWPVRSVRYV